MFEKNLEFVTGTKCLDLANNVLTIKIYQEMVILYRQMIGKFE